MSEQFLRTEMLLGGEAMARLSHAHVAVFGIGGVGSWCAEALARAGVGALTLIDHDDIGLTNLNRQVVALHSTIGQGKAEAMACRIADIAPSCRTYPLRARYEASNREEFFATRYDYIADAIDLVSCKLDLIQSALSRELPIISALGTGNKLDPSLFCVTDISKTEGCPLARIIRKELRLLGIRRHQVVFSPEQAIKPLDLDSEAAPPGRRSVPASAPWVPPVAGFLMAGAIIRSLASV